MKIEFEPGAAGFREATHLQRLTRVYRTSQTGGSDMLAFVENLEIQAGQHADREEFAGLREQLPAEDTPVVTSRGLAKRVLGVIFRPSPVEMELSAQRSEAMERAERAEALAFDAMAEMARTNQARDEALSRISALEAELSSARQALESRR